MAEYSYAEMANMHLIFGHVYGNEDEAHSLSQEHL
jgi:hypothetical protein